MKKTFEVDVNLTPEELASIWCNMKDGEQAAFFSEIGLLVEEWDVGFCFQLQYITDNETLTDSGRRIMEQIGEYANKEPEGI